MPILDRAALSYGRWASWADFRQVVKATVVPTVKSLATARATSDCMSFSMPLVRAASVRLRMI